MEHLMFTGRKPSAQKGKLPSHSKEGKSKKGEGSYEPKG